MREGGRRVKKKKKEQGKESVMSDVADEEKERTAAPLQNKSLFPALYWGKSQIRNKGRGQLEASFYSPIWRNYDLTARRRDRGGEACVIISDINDIRRLSVPSEGITNPRRKKNTGHMRRYVSVWVKEDKMCRIPNCFPTLSEAHSLNPVNDYTRYLRYHL